MEIVVQPFHLIYKDLIIYIFTFLDLTDFLKVVGVCKSFYELSKSDVIWKSLFIKEFVTDVLDVGLCCPQELFERQISWIEKFKEAKEYNSFFRSNNPRKDLVSLIVEYITFSLKNIEYENVRGNSSSKLAECYFRMIKDVIQYTTLEERNELSKKQEYNLKAKTVYELRR